MSPNSTGCLQPASEMPAASEPAMTPPQIDREELASELQHAAEGVGRIAHAAARDPLGFSSAYRTFDVLRRIAARLTELASGLVNGAARVALPSRGAVMLVRCPHCRELFQVVHELRRCTCARTAAHRCATGAIECSEAGATLVALELGRARPRPSRRVPASIVAWRDFPPRAAEHDVAPIDREPEPKGR